ncbi:hypothetical protein [Flavobacterium sp.]|uniref:hypothetical protein n=1 Tax=Flavobacterium sp. TaxID=239 RepID=UPI0025CE5283|nr:hypothetical protein [Flavobacterium sp.]
MLKKIKNLIQENIKFHKAHQDTLSELYWANVYHDSIRGKSALENLGLNIGRWAGNYTFFYILNRILNDYQPKKIIEFGLGESTKFISTYIENYAPDSVHTVIEQDENWRTAFLNRFRVSNKTTIKVLPLTTQKVHGFDTNSYAEIGESVNEKFDLYVVDGPFGSDHYSRYDIVTLAEKLDANDEFIIIIDDYNRKGEQQTVQVLIKMLEQKGIAIHKGQYKGLKTVLILATEQYKYIKTL